MSLMPRHPGRWPHIPNSNIAVCPLQVSPIIDRTVLKTVKAAFGGRVRFVVSGGAPLGPSVEAFLNITLCCPVLQVCTCLLNISLPHVVFVCCSPVGQKLSAVQAGSHSLFNKVLVCCC